MFDRIQIKGLAKSHYKLNTSACVVVAAIMTFLNGGMGGFSAGYNFGNNTGNFSEPNVTGDVGESTVFFVTIVIIMVILAALATLFSILVTNVVLIGGNGWFLRSIRGNTGGVSEMFWNFRSGNYGSAVKLGALRMVYIFLWSLLFIIPGIIKKYEYSLADYIKAENPSIGASECLNLSSRMTQGHKMELFILDLSFIGWHILSSFTCGILGLIYVFPYYYCSYAYAYESIRAEAINSGRISESEVSIYY